MIFIFDWSTILLFQTIEIQWIDGFWIGLAGQMAAVAHSEGGTTEARTTSEQLEFPAQNERSVLRAISILENENSATMGPIEK